MKYFFVGLVIAASQVADADCGIQYGYTFASNGSSTACYVLCDNGGVSGGAPIPDDICNTQYGAVWAEAGTDMICVGAQQGGGNTGVQVADGYCGQP